MEKRAEWVAFCKELPGVYEDYPFEDPNWTVMRHIAGQKSFAYIYERQGRLWLNLKCSPEEGDFLRRACPGIFPAYHMNKTHWITADPSETDCDTLKALIRRSWELTLSPGKKQPGSVPSSKKCPRP